MKIKNTKHSNIDKTGDIPVDTVRKILQKELGITVLEKIAKNPNIDVDILPHFSNRDFNDFPILIKELAFDADEGTHRDIVLFGLLGLISGVLPNIRGIYAGSFVEANIFSFIVGPFASGKGEINRLRKLFEPIQKKMLDKYKEQLREYLERTKDGDGHSDLSAPIKKFLFIPADNSKTGFIELLAQSDGRGILIDTEADTLTSTFKLEFGNYSDILRKIFHNETVSYYRRTNKEKIDIDNPKLSVILGGTFDQFQTMFFNESNGLLSRFICYNVKPSMPFKNVFETLNDGKRVQIHTKYKAWFSETYEKLSGLEESYTFQLSDDQKKLFVNYFEKEKQKISNLFSKEDAAFIHRFSLVIFKVMLILTACDNIVEIDFEPTLICSNRNFLSGIRIYEVLREHFFYSFSKLITGKEKYIRDVRKVKELIFNYRTHGMSYRMISLRLNIPLGTVYRYVNG